MDAGSIDTNQPVDVIRHYYELIEVDDWGVLRNLFPTSYYELTKVGKTHVIIAYRAKGRFSLVRANRYEIHACPTVVEVPKAYRFSCHGERLLGRGRVRHDITAAEQGRGRPRPYRVRGPIRCRGGTCAAQITLIAGSVG